MKMIVGLLLFCMLFSPISGVAAVAEELQSGEPSGSLETVSAGASIAGEGGGEAAHAPRILITELLPHPNGDPRKGSGNQYEFLELYNHSDDMLDLFGYTLWYLYPNATAPKKWVIPVHTQIEPRSAAILWFAKEAIADGYGTASDFNQFFGTVLPESDIIQYDNRNTTDFNLPNAENRGLGLSSPEQPDAMIVQAWYDSKTASSPDRAVNDVRNSVVRYSYPEDGNTMRRLDTRPYPNPGVIDPGQVPAADVGGAPVIDHTPVPSVNVGEDLAISASVTDPDGDPLNVVLQYKAEAGGNYSQAPMTVAGSVYAYAIPSDAITGSKVYYRIAAGDGVHQTVSAEYETIVSGRPAAQAPRILITELLPHPFADYRTGGGNQYEFAELYNNSDETLNLKDYTLWYLYPGGGTPKKWKIPQDTAIEPYSAAVIWFAKEAVTAGFTTTADFNTHFNTSLTDEDIVFYNNAASSDFNLPNATHRGLGLSSAGQPNDLIVEAWYDSTSPGSPDRMAAEVRNTVIRFATPAEGRTMQRIGTRLYANPGSIDPGQVPAAAGVDAVAPTLTHDQPAYNIAKNEPYTVTVTSDEPLNASKSKIVYGRIDSGEGAFADSASLRLVSEQGDSYVYEGALTIAETGNYRYMIEAEDESGHSTRLPYNSLGAPLTVNDSVRQAVLPEIGLSVEEGAMVRGTASLYAHAGDAGAEVEVAFGGTPLSLRRALPGSVQFGLQGKGIDQIYQSSLSAIKPDGEMNYFARLLPKYVEGAWTLEEMDPSYFVADNIVSVHAGNENAPYDVESHDKFYGINNHDDFDVKNIHLALPDGTLVKPDFMVNYSGERNATQSPYLENAYFAIGDGNAQKALISEFHFPIPDGKYTSKYAEIDTTGYADGSYPVAMKIGQNPIETVQVTVDNTAPVLQGIRIGDGQWLTDGMKLKGTVRLEAEVSDNLTGIASVEASLDGQSIVLPYETSSVALAPGNHTLLVKAADGAGNVIESAYSFVVEDERPLEPTDVKPADFASNVPLNAKLEATFADPTGDKMKVDFFKGDKFDFARTGGMKGFVHVADREPPLAIAPAGENGMDAAESAKVKAPDGDYLVTDSQSGFPYHRFEIEVGDIAGNTAAELYWKGRTLPGRIVTLYAWDYADSKWVALKRQTGVSENEDIVLAAEVQPDRYVRDGVIEAMVQDEVKSANDPFTLLWFTDTQYYAESYPDIFDKLGDWIPEEYEKGSFSYAIHTGDVVNVANDEAQWAVADRNLKKLDDANVPYGLLAGNHDVILDGVNYTYFGKYVGAHRYEDKPWYGGQMNDNQNHYDLISVGGHDFIILYIGFGLENTEETVAWANEALKKHADRNAIVGLHAYLEPNGTLSNMAQQVYDEIIAPNKNVQMVLSGHYHAAKRVVKTVKHEDGTERQVLEILADYQGGPNGGDGYLRYLHFDPVAETVDVRTYSPVLDDYNFFEDDVDSFTESFDLRDIDKRVSTDYFAVNLYTEEKLGSRADVNSGSAASVMWNGLLPGQTYYWYMNIADEFGAERRSSIYRFATERTGGPGGNPGENPGGNNGGAAGGTDGSGAGVIRVEPQLSGGKAVLTVSDSALAEAFGQAAPDGAGVVTIAIEASAASLDGADAISVVLPSDYLTLTDAVRQIRIATPLGEVTLPSDMLGNDASVAGKNAELTIEAVDRSGLTDGAKEGVGGRPAIDIGLRLNGQPVEWTNEATRVSVSVPYAPAAGENADNLVVWYLDGNGGIETVISGKYDAAAGAVTFETEHFSTYAVAYKQLAFGDVGISAWYHKAVNYLSSRELVNGMGDGRFAPNANVTRADFLMMTMNALGIEAEAGESDTFLDAGDKYYSPYLATAKRLGIVNGLEGNRFAPEQSISRQDMMVMLYRAFNASGIDISVVKQVGLGSYSDGEAVSGYATQAVTAMLQSGLVQGSGDKLEAMAVTTRAMAAQTLYNYLASR
ncbi:S-layer homology domain-containing protein [Paenibacillus arenilitoris]|uniref:S-layer homology domain-containing protein n=1 Tax=Paenibacillus arenilitoris TaxID=2772299 RepID=A0A927CKZ5_9BACL|nr:S-layer homology domain-containing protein [Paenibacillus arenilitoris]MBD2867791.1 S-layer homology domain-containing protein [Paenibacillus arenilitoris]